jgi:hypothetical protein
MADEQPDRQCLQCGKVYRADVMICIPCGIHLETGRPIATRYEAEDAEDEDGGESKAEAPGAWMRFMMAVGPWLPGLFRPLTLALFVVMTILAVLTEALCLFVFALGAPFSAVPIGAGGLFIYAQGVAWLLTAQVVLLHDALMELDGRRWLVFFLLIGGPLMIGFAVLAVARRAGG